MADPKPPRDDGYGIFSDQLERLKSAVSKLETASGTQRVNLRDEVMKLFNDLSAQVEEQISASSYTRAQIDDKVAHPGDVAATGNLSVAGIISSPGTRANPISTFRTVVWEEAGSAMGFSSSTRRVKQDIVDAPVDEDAFRSVKPRHFRYIAEVDALGDDARVDRGFIAEELVSAGFTEPVYRDAEGLPEGVNYDRLTPFLWGVVQSLLDDRDELRDRLARVEAQLSGD